MPAGLFTLDVVLGVGTFQYGRRYVERPNAIAIDPVNLPLTGKEYVSKMTTMNSSGGWPLTCLSETKTTISEITVLFKVCHGVRLW